MRLAPGTPGPAGQLDREALGQLVFSDGAARARLNAATHLPIYVELLRQLLWHWLTLRWVVVSRGQAAAGRSAAAAGGWGGRGAKGVLSQSVLPCTHGLTSRASTA